MQIFYTVRQGDSLYGIAKRWELFQSIPSIAANNIAPPYAIQIGQQLSVPPGVDVVRVSQEIRYIIALYRIPLRHIRGYSSYSSWRCDHVPFYVFVYLFIILITHTHSSHLIFPLLISLSIPYTPSHIISFIYFFHSYFLTPLLINLQMTCIYVDCANSQKIIYQTKECFVQHSYTSSQNKRINAKCCRIPK